MLSGQGPKLEYTGIGRWVKKSYFGVSPWPQMIFTVFSVLKAF